MHAFSHIVLHSVSFRSTKHAGRSKQQLVLYPHLGTLFGLGEIPSKGPGLSSRHLPAKLLGG